MKLFISNSSHSVKLTNTSTVLTLKTNIGCGGIYEHYSGEYVVTPDTSSITLLTNEKVMDDDVTINGIPYSSVDNIQGGRTITIA